MNNINYLKIFKEQGLGNEVESFKLQKVCVICGMQKVDVIPFDEKGVCIICRMEFE